MARHSFLLGFLATVIGSIASLASAEEQAAQPTIHIVSDSSGQPAAVEVVDIPKSRLTKLAAIPDGDERWGQTFGLYVADPDSPSPPAMLGRYTVHNGRLRFTPRYALRPGMKYQAVLRLPGSTAASGPTIVRRDIDVRDSQPSEPTKLVAIYPSADVLPENQLRFYLHFSAPMGRGEAYRHLRMLNEKNEPIDMPFLEIGEELWDPTGTRLTLLIDPGRIKREVKPREELGPVLSAGHKYQLVIAPGWRDEAGHGLAKGAVKRFLAGPPRSLALDQHDWKLQTPAAGSREPLVLTFPQPLDHALLQRTIVVVRAGEAASESLSGAITIGQHEQRWEFRPDQSWPAGRYEIVVDTTLEDLAGNRIGVPFEVDRVGTIERRIEIETARLPFVISRPPAPAN
jgi:hypothetical protein